MSYVALYRKYRPKTFDEVRGQSAIVQTLRNQIISNRIGHAYLFCGPRGTGKTSIAKILSKAINCINPVNGNPCGTCECCKKTANGLNTDIIEIDAASNNGVDNIRELIEESKYLPQHGKYKVYIIDEVHMLSNSAFNALLKTLEEPVSNTIFILATTEENKIPATIYSRCQKFQFKLIKEEEIVNALQDILSKENVQWENDSVLMHIAKMANGGLRDAFSLIDQCATYITNDCITVENVQDVFGEIKDTVISTIAQCIEDKNITKIFDIVSEQQQNGKTLSGICLDMYEYYKQTYFDRPENDLIKIQRYMSILAELSEKMKYNNNRTVFEIEIIKMCTPQMETDYASLYQRVQELEDIVAKLLNGHQTIISNPAPIDESEFVTIYASSHPQTCVETYYI